MLYNKEAAIAAMAIMLVAAPFLGGFLPSPAFADPVQVAQRTITPQDDEESTTVEGVEFSARKATVRSSGTIFVKVMQNETELASATTSTNSLPSTIDFTSVVLDLADQEVTGSFDIVIQYEGSGGIEVSEIELSDGQTDTAGEQTENGGQDGSTETAGNSGSQTLPEGFEIARTFVENSGETADVDAVEFSVRKATVRTAGTVTVAIVQGNNVLDTFDFSAGNLDVVNYQDMEATFDVRVTGDYEIVFIFLGKGGAQVTGIDIVGATTPASEEDPEEGNGNGEGQTDESPNVMLRIEAEDEDGNELTGMFVTIFQGMTTVATDYTPWEIELEDGEYTVRAHDFDDDSTNTHIHFVRWADKKSNAEDRFRFANLTNFDEETFTAVYSVEGSTGTAGGDTNTGTNNTNTGDTNDGDTNTGDTNAGSDTNTGGSGDMTVEAGQVGVRSVLLDGTEAPGFQVQLRDTNGDILETKFTPAVFENVEPGQRIVMYSAGNTYFRSWSDNGLHRYHVVEADDLGTVLTTRYENVPADQDAHLVVIARTADGEVIGGTTGTETDGTLSATPGLEVTVAPPGTMTPYTAGFTGGSEISEHFFFFDGQTYTIVIQEYPPYTFSHWEDNPSFTNRARVVNLNGDTTLVAIFNEN